MGHKQLYAESDRNQLDRQDHMPRLEWQGSIAPQISGLQTKRHVQAGNNGSHHRNEAAPPSQAKLLWQASCKPRRSDVNGFGRDRVQPQGRKRDYIWSRRSHSARSVCTCAMVNGCACTATNYQGSYIQEAWRQYISSCLRIVFVSGRLFRSMARTSSILPATFEAKGNA